MLLTSVETANALEISANSLTITGEIINENREQPIAQLGHVLGTNREPLLNVDVSTALTPSDTSFTFVSTIDSLEAETTYFVRAYLKSGGKITYGKSLQFVTTGGNSSPPFTLRTRSATNISNTSAIAEAEILDAPDIVPEWGHVWSPNVEEIINIDDKNNPNILQEVSTSIDENGIYRTNMNNLIPNTDYWLKAYVKVKDSNNNDVYYYSDNTVKLTTAQ
ncbi:MAG: hypothetical protein AAFU64_06835 [Bacteroidota bacterium]